MYTNTQANIILGSASSFFDRIARPLHKKLVNSLAKHDPSFSYEAFTDSFQKLCKILNFDSDNPREIHIDDKGTEVLVYLEKLDFQVVRIKQAGKNFQTIDTDHLLLKLLCELTNPIQYGSGRPLDDLVLSANSVEYVNLADWGTAGLRNELYQEICRLPIFPNLKVAVLFGGYFYADHLEDFEFGKMTNLCYLDLAEGNLYELPKGITQLANLQALDLTQNPLEELPESIKNLATNLKFLLLQDTELPPEKIQQLKLWLPNTNILT
ncbi:MAG: hypothetical protein AAF518_04780 [Spirochaetota bacterium]